MYKYLRWVLLLIVIPNSLFSQIFPTENSVLNYRVIGFVFPTVEKCNGYIIEIAKGAYDNNELFQKNIVKKEECNTNRIIAEVPSFGTAYTWCITYLNNKNVIKKSRFYYFHTGMTNNVDTSCKRLRIINNTDRYDNNYIFLDNGKVLYNMKGQPVWYLPAIDNVIHERCIPRDIKLTPQGTITMLVLNYAYEISYSGKILWRAPIKNVLNPDSSEHYHHELTRLSNGHYMVFGAEPGIVKFDNRHVANAKIKTVLPSQNTEPIPAPVQIQDGRIIEYDKNGKVVWTWRVSDYLSKSDIIYHKTPEGTVNADVHENSFYFDEINKTIYISFKNIDRILKIKYPERTVLSEYGEKYKPGIPEKGNGIFCGQHCIRKSVNGYLYLYNNNMCTPDGNPKITILKEVKPDSMQLLWEYECTNEGISAEHFKARSASGGSVEELPDGAILACMGTPSSKILIVNRNKEVLWSALPEQWAEMNNNWRMTPLYRVNMITDTKDFERLIWNDQGKQPVQ